MEKKDPSPLAPCPLLPAPAGRMSYRDLQQPVPSNGNQVFHNACAYANYLWLKGMPARAILALCRAIYLDPEILRKNTVQPFAAYVWFLRNYRKVGFLGNPRISFARQATRINPDRRLKIARAWAMWHLTNTMGFHFAPDPDVVEDPPEITELQAFLNGHGLINEGNQFLYALTGSGQKPRPKDWDL